MPEVEPGQSTEVRSTPRLRVRWWPRIALLLGVLAAVVAVYASGLDKQLTRENLLLHLETYRSIVAENEALAVLVFFLVYVTLTALSVPVGAWLSLLAGALFGRWLGTGVVIFAATLGATMAFLATRYLFAVVVQRLFNQRLAALNANIEREGAYYLFTMRLIPAIPFWLINLGMGLTSMRVLTFAGISLVGMLPGTFLYVNAGVELANIRSLRDIASLPVIGSLVALGLLPLLLRKILQWRGPRPTAPDAGPMNTDSANLQQ